MKFSIITPSLNQAAFIEKTIVSVINQTEVNFEYIVIDGGSEDGTLNILKKYQHALQFVSEKDQGQAHAVNKGLRMASGDIVGWLNSDDIYYPQTLAKVHNAFLNSNNEVVYGNAHYIDQHDQVINCYPTEKWNINSLKKTCFISQPATFFRRDLIHQHGLLNQQLHYCMDYEYWLRLGLANVKFLHLKEVLAGARLYPENKSSQFLKANVEAMEMVKEKLGYLPHEWLVNHAMAKVKNSTALYYPQIEFIYEVWKQLWYSTELEFTGLSRVMAWFYAQMAMVEKFYRKKFVY